MVSPDPCSKEEETTPGISEEGMGESQEDETQEGLWEGNK